MASFQAEGFYIFLGACWLLVLCQAGIRSCRGDSNENATDTNNQDSSGLTLEERQEAARQDRRLTILTTLLHKKVMAKPDESEVTLPHEEILSNRSTHSIFDEESHKLKRKDDIFVEKFNSWRSSRRHLSESSFQSETLYSPRTCSICLGFYRVDEDICWSPNENCHHAFHLDCMMEWLMVNDECPLCRENYLESKSSR
mmetsp:Transcript_10033/g.18820  ORF Transcript_10033/g.18820 Transcript_10033/m.18820 type:complete len:199 (-) Transcript_10033:1659-2255(-)